MARNQLRNEMRRNLRKLPGAYFLYRKAKDAYLRRRAAKVDVEGIFTNIYKGNKFGGTTSVSGPGADSTQTSVIVERLPALLSELSCTTVLDIPCGDFSWMKSVRMSNVRYLGADIVEELVRENQTNYGSEKVHFQKLDLLKDELPKVDLVLCRDCLVHFSNDDVVRAIINIVKSESMYLLTTTFPERARNRDIFTGEWRPINLELPPVSLPAPEKLLNEQCVEAGGWYADKCLGLWRIESLANRLRNDGDLVA